jgi:hypothetical protein
VPQQLRRFTAFDHGGINAATDLQLNTTQKIQKIGHGMLKHKQQGLLCTTPSSLDHPAGCSSIVLP